jgi:HEPN domain-containing protein
LPQKTALTRDELKKLARLRLKEAEYLNKQGLYDGCVYLCGYVVECALKARICKFLGLSTYPSDGEHGRIFKTHNFGILKLLAGLEGEITITKNKALFDNWSTATKWDPEQRYAPAGTYDRQKATEVLASIKDKPNGVLTWLTKRC